MNHIIMHIGVIGVSEASAAVVSLRRPTVRSAINVPATCHVRR